MFSSRSIVLTAHLVAGDGRPPDRQHHGLLLRSPAGHRTRGTRPVIDGLSSRALSEIICLEHTRNYLQPGDVGAASGLWRDYVHQPERVLWHDYEWGSNAHRYCCGDPLEARALSIP
ncbi:hypothetical protein GCM10018789_35810 [Streptomyces werraensis]|nr:hypothetical protein GCM10018789_35810 [Streptomyces werraensis]